MIKEIKLPIDFTVYEPNLRTKKEKGTRYIFDPIRRKYLILQPEELVRQLVLIHLVQKQKYNPNRIRVEKGLKVNTLSKRCDILVYDQLVKPWLLVECKAPFIAINQEVFDQAARYNMELEVKFLMLTNGETTYCCIMDHEKRSYTFLDRLPPYPT